MSKTALLAMDLQESILSRVSTDYLPRAVEAVTIARHNDIPVIHIAVRLRRGHTNAHPRNAVFGALPEGAFTEDDPSSGIHPDIAPRPEEIVVHKTRVSAFAGNDLAQILAAQGIDHLVLAGVATSGVVVSTALQAVDLDYTVTVLGDGCTDSDAETHEAVLRLLGRRCAVGTTADWAREPHPAD